MPHPPLISQLKPFSAQRFDACMNYLMHQYSATPDQYSITKLHVMIDFFHILETGKPVIGGPLSPWTYGPVVKPGYDRVRWLGHRFDENGEPTHRGKLRVTGKHKKYHQYAPHGKVDPDEFSDRERNAMRRAWETIAPMDFQQRDDFFHSVTSYMGKVWSRAKAEESAIDWGDLVEAYDNQFDEDHAHARMMIDMWRQA